MRHTIDLIYHRFHQVCLDGSPAGFYIWRAQNDVRAIQQGYANHWIIFFEGGGWCHTPEDCAIRSVRADGSSKGWARQANKGCAPRPQYAIFLARIRCASAFLLNADAARPGARVPLAESDPAAVTPQNLCRTGTSKRRQNCCQQ